MKGSVVLILISLSLAISIALQASKTAGSTDDSSIARIGKGLEGAKAFIPPGSTLSFCGEPGDYAPYIQARYLLAPRAMNVVPVTTTPDTLLSIQYIYSGDSTLNSVIAQRRLLWEHKDDRYRYTLTTLN